MKPALRSSMLAAILLVVLVKISTAARLQSPSVLEPIRYWRFKSKKQCPFVENGESSLQSQLLNSDSFVSRDDAANKVLQSFRTWKATPVLESVNGAIGHAGGRSPLILVFTGPTGTSKTTMAEAIGHALSSSTKSTHSGRQEPEALFVINGPDLYLPPDAPQEELRRKQAGVKEAVAQALYECHGQAVIIFDEMQKAADGMLGFLSELSGSASPGLWRYTERDEQGNRLRSLSLDASRSIFVIITDVGEESVSRWVLSSAAEAYAHGISLDDTSSSSRLWEELKTRLGWQLRNALSISSSRFGVDLGAHASAVIPFFPYRQTEAHAILRAALRQVTVRMQKKATDELWMYLQERSELIARQQTEAAKAGVAISESEEEGPTIWSSSLFKASGHEDDEEGGLASPAYHFLRLDEDFLAALGSDPSNLRFSWDKSAFDKLLQQAEERKKKLAAESAAVAVDAKGNQQSVVPSSGGAIGGDAYQGLRRKLKDFAILDYGARSLMRAGGESSPVSAVIRRIEDAATASSNNDGNDSGATCRFYPSVSAAAAAYQENNGGNGGGAEPSTIKALRLLAVMSQNRPLWDALHGSDEGGTAIDWQAVEAAIDRLEDAIHGTSETTGMSRQLMTRLSALAAPASSKAAAMAAHIKRAGSLLTSFFKDKRKQQQQRQGNGKTTFGDAAMEVLEKAKASQARIERLLAKLSSSSTTPKEPLLLPGVARTFLVDAVCAGPGQQEPPCKEAGVGKLRIRQCKLSVVEENKAKEESSGDKCDGTAAAASIGGLPVKETCRVAYLGPL
jgi:ATPase family associated with various cellular activities (AAA)